MKTLIQLMLTGAITLSPALSPTTSEVERSAWMLKYEWVQYNVKPGTPLVLEADGDKTVPVFMLARDVNKLRVEPAVIDPDMPLKKNMT